MSSFKYSYDNVDFEVDSLPEKINDWICKKSEIYEYSKEEEIVKGFNSSFPHITLLGDSYEDKFNFLSDVVSRSLALQEWFANEKVKYSELAQLPRYLKGNITPKEFNKIQEDVTYINDLIAEDAKIRNELASEYKRQLNEADKNLKKKLSDIKVNNNVLKVVTLTSQSLPLSMLTAIESFNVKSQDSEFDEKKRYIVREMLINYKVALLKLVKENEDIDVDKVIAELSLK